MHEYSFISLQNISLHVQTDSFCPRRQFHFLLNTSLHVATLLQFLLNTSLHVASYAASVPPEHKFTCIATLLQFLLNTSLHVATLLQFLLNTSLHVATLLQFLLNTSLHVAGYAASVPILNTSLHVATQLQFLLNTSLHVSVYTAFNSSLNATLNIHTQIQFHTKQKSECTPFMLHCAFEIPNYMVQKCGSAHDRVQSKNQYF